MPNFSICWPSEESNELWQRIPSWNVDGCEFLTAQLLESGIVFPLQWHSNRPGIIDGGPVFSHTQTHEPAHILSSSCSWYGNQHIKRGKEWAGSSLRDMNICCFFSSYVRAYTAGFWIVAKRKKQESYLDFGFHQTFEFWCHILQDKGHQDRVTENKPFAQMDVKVQKTESRQETNWKPKVQSTKQGAHTSMLL